MPFTGELIDTVRASRFPLTSSLPIALTHSPFLTPDAVPVLVASYVVVDVVLTVVVVDEPNVDFTVNDEPPIEEMVPKAPPNRPAKPPRPPIPDPGKLLLVGNGREVLPSPNPPAGGVKLPPPGKPPPVTGPPCWQPVVLVTVIEVAVIVVGTDCVPVAVVPEPEPLDTITQSPLASEDRVVEAVAVKRVSEL